MSLTFAWFGPLIVLLGLIVGLSLVPPHPLDGAISFPRCSASATSLGGTSVTLTASLPQPRATVLVGHHLLVLVPHGVGFFHIVNDKALHSVCASVLTDHDTEVVVTALAPGQSNIGAESTVVPGPAMGAVFGAHVEVSKVQLS